MTSGNTVVFYPSRFVQFTMFLEPNAEGSSSHCRCGGFVVTRDVVDGVA